jgi:hypothetical protein
MLMIKSKRLTITLISIQKTLMTIIGIELPAESKRGVVLRMSQAVSFVENTPDYKR